MPETLWTVGPDGEKTYSQAVFNFAKNHWDADPHTFVNWDTLTFQAVRDEGDSRQKRDAALAKAYEILLEERLRRKNESAPPKLTLEVWKFQYDIMRGKDVQEFHMPKGAKILTVREHVSYNDQLAINIWALVNPEAEKTPRQIQVVGTGHTVPNESLYLGTAFFGSIVLHVWETFTP